MLLFYLKLMRKQNNKILPCFIKADAVVVIIIVIAKQL